MDKLYYGGKVYGGSKGKEGYPTMPMTSFRVHSSNQQGHNCLRHEAKV